jgi:hypothetical protein
MKNYLGYIIVLALITIFCAGFVSAAGSGPASENKSANETIQIQPVFISAPSETDQANLTRTKAMLPPEIQQSLEEQKTFKESVTKAIAEKEGQLVRSPLIINDSFDITGEAKGFFVSNETTSTEPVSKESGVSQPNISAVVTILPVNQIPSRGFITFGHDGKTRVFTSEGIQISYAVDDRSGNVTTPSGKELPSTHIIGIPNGAASHTRGNTEYITMKGEVILTIIDQSSKDTIGENIVPSARSLPWVEYAESDPYYIAAVHSYWGIPQSPNLPVPAGFANMLFNGVEPSDGSMIFQPVTAFNFYAHSLLSGSAKYIDPAIVNKWTGSSWICPLNNNYCTHSTPILDFSQGELAYGGIFWYEAPVLEWLIYLVNDSNQGTWIYSDHYIYSQPSRAVVVYEFGGSDPSGLYPNDNQKITSTTFSNISVWDTIGNQISSLHWTGIVNNKDHKKITGLNVDLSQAPSIVILNTSDYRTKIGVFRNSTHIYYQDFNGNGLWEGAVIDRSYDFGITGDIPVSGDWNGDGRDEIGVFRPSTHMYYQDHNGNGTWNGAVIDRMYNFGITGDMPVSGDWNGNGFSEIGVFRPSTHMYYRDYNGNGVWDGAVIDRASSFGITGDIPVSGDWNGNGISKIGVFRPSTHLYYEDYNGNGVWDGAVIDRAYNFGTVGDIGVSGDWNNDGRTDIGVFRPSTSQFCLDSNGNGVWDGSLIDRVSIFGINGDSPVSGMWN